MVDSDYSPSGFVWKDPRNLSKEAIQDLLNHIRCRQERYGPNEGFRFHSYVNAKEIVEAQYGINANTQKAAERNKKQQSSRKKNRENVGKALSQRKKKGKKSPCPGAVGGSAKDTAEADVTAGAAVNANVTVANECRTPFIPQIDPALLGNDTIPIIPVTNDTQQSQDSGGYTDDIGMQLLIANGFPNTIPVNGPQDGPPRYFVSSAAMLFISNHTGNNSTIIDDSANIQTGNNSTINNESGNIQISKKTKYGRKRNSIDEATVQKPRRSGRVRENDLERQRQTRSQKRVEAAKKR